MRLASFNVLHGRAPDGGTVPPGLLAEACVSLGADVVCLQEIDRGQERSGDVDQTARIAEAMGATAWRFEPALIGEPGGRWRAAEDADSAAGDGTADSAAAGDGTAGDGTAGYGVGIVSRLPVRDWRVLRLPAARVRSPVFVPGRRAVILLDDEPRVGLVAELDGPQGPLLVATTHLSFVPGWNVVQLRRLTHWLAGFGHPAVLLGDLNLPGALPRWTSGWRALATVRTFPADKPSMQLDHALGRGRLPAVVGVDAPRLPLSDHRALVVDLAG